MKKPCRARQSLLPWQGPALCGALLWLGQAPRAAPGGPIIKHALQVHVEPATHHRRACGSSS